MSAIERVHVVFKTHLDIGFTDLASNVIDRYMHAYIPKAISLAEELETAGGKARFVWTTGSWLIQEYLLREDTDHERMVHAIERGHIVWHGLPFTTHTELQDPSLFQYGLSIAERLDRRFNRHTIAAKMTDVPGHTIGMVGPMADRGMRYLHIGVNPASRVPEVPELFIWRTYAGAEIIVNYAIDYGGAVQVEGVNEVLVFAHTGDNLGPPSADEIRLVFERLAQQYPQAAIMASTMDKYAAALVEAQHRLPVLQEEIGDTWIHGVGTDPWKVAAYRALSRLRTNWLKSGRWTAEAPEDIALANELLLVSEHTWGLDEKLHLSDYRNYSRPSFQEARMSDRTSASSVPAKYTHFTPFAMLNEDTGGESTALRASGSYSFMEHSWQEQRQYMERAIQTLPESLAAEARAELANLSPNSDIPHGAVKLEVGKKHTFGSYTVQFDGEGAIMLLQELQDSSGKVWCDGGHRLGVFSYETFGSESYERWYSEYLRNRAITHSWSEADFGKPGIEFASPSAQERSYSPMLMCLAAVVDHNETRVYARLAMQEEAVSDYGAPAIVLVEYVFPDAGGYIDIHVHWTGKAANRQPEAIWFSLNPAAGNANRWRMNKLGEWLSPLDVVRGGNRSLHAVHEGVRYDSGDAVIRIDTLDAPLVAPGTRSLLRSNDAFGSMEGGWHFLLYNNVWGTNFPMWYEDDAKFRFRLTLKKR